MIERAQVLSFKLVGSNKQHVQIQLLVGNKIIDCIGFSMGYVANQLWAGGFIDVAGELLADSWNGVKKLKLRLFDIKTLEVAEQL